MNEPHDDREHDEIRDMKVDGVQDDADVSTHDEIGYIDACDTVVRTYRSMIITFC